MKKIFVIYATAGIGHKKASLAIKAALDELAPKDTKVSIFDSLDYTNAFFKWSYLQSYLLMVNKFPTFWGIGYHLSDNFYVNLVVSKIRQLNNWLNSNRLRKHLLAEQPDVIISTHFFASEVIANLKKKGALKSRLVTVVTDYRLHSWWVADPTDMYVVGSEEARGDLIRWKADPSRIKVLGIPVEPVFSRPLDKKAIRDKTGLKDGMPTILVIGGGFGVGPIENIVKIIDSMPQEAQVITVCGHNDTLVKRLESMKPVLNKDVKVFGFVNNVYEYMAVSDVLISKSGGITTAESLAKELPMIVISPIIGQETRNSRLLTSRGAAVKIDSLSELKGVLEDLASHPGKLKAMRESIAGIRKPMACYDIAKLAVEMCG